MGSGTVCCFVLQVAGIDLLMFRSNYQSIFVHKSEMGNASTAVYDCWLDDPQLCSHASGPKFE